ncbi:MULTISPECIES: tyrosine-type recombinase/integrase [Streptomyces]|uniref:tyrosine-type recombinase/integrase n=1 Tax=Streptomyces TaxID=1883 RepID=UPI0004E732AA|nr:MULTISPECIES: site-specific integrase [Streptomyces]KFG05956.1 integrase [Streptomyces scabiei]MDX2837123.1 site-specific integrase [Streptomyces scabiei]MDX3681776.1 site-specific integrase [Streptomyces scabiei]
MAGRKPQRRREFGTTRQLPSGRWQARYIGPDGQRHTAPETFETKSDAQDWLNLVRADIERDVWRDPDAGAVNFQKYALRWMEERGLAPTTVDRYDGLLRLHILPTFSGKDLDEITPPSVRTWRAERLKATGATTVAKSYRLLKAILQTAVDDDLLRTNPCRIKGAGKEEADERPTATIEQVFDLADAMGPRWRLMVLLGAFASLRPEELAELRRHSVDVDECSLRITQASPELTNGKRVTGDPKTRAGKRTVYLPDFLKPDLRRHLQWFAEKEPNGLLFVGEKGAPFRRSTFGRKWRKARTKVGMPDNFRFYDLRHTGNTLAADTGAKLKDLMVRAGQSSERAQLIYQHSTVKHQRRLAQGIDTEVRAQLREAGSAQPGAREA